MNSPSTSSIVGAIRAGGLRQSIKVTVAVIPAAALVLALVKSPERPSESDVRNTIVPTN